MSSTYQFCIFVSSVTAPYVIAAKANMLENGDYKTEFLGTVARARVVAVYPLSMGLKIAAELDTIKADYDVRERKLAQEKRDAFAKVLPELKNFSE